jgi:NADH-quinone oxidoreductase subunit I
VRDTTQRPTPRHSETRPGLPARSRGVIALVEENCTACMLCARECPDWCIYIDSHKETVPAPEGGRPRVRNVLDRFAIDFSLCMYCGICVEVCPFDALFWSPEFEYAGHDIRDLLHEKDRLGEWVATVPNLPPSVRREASAPATEAASAVPEATPEQAETPVRPAAAATATERPTSGTAVPGPGGRPRSGAGSARELLTNVRSIRPPGGLPGGASAAPEPGGSPTEKPGGARRPSARDLLANVRSIRPPGALPGGASAAPEPGGSPTEKPGGARRPSARELLANVRSIRPPGGLPKDRDDA